MRRTMMETRTTRTDVLGILGLARRAGSVVTGTGAVRDVVRTDSARFVLLAEDAAVGQVGKVANLLRHRTVPWTTWGTREELGRAVGAAPLSAIAIMDDGFARRLREELRGDEGPTNGSVSDEDG
jgi:ribosomal protein L7Ae-like RNA K-turn-binding protein